MSLLAKVQERFSESRLVQLTRPEQSSFTTVDSTFLQAVCDDIEGYFDAESAGSYDDDDKAAVAVACDGVVALAQWRIVTSDGNERRWKDWLERLDHFGQTRRRDRINPVATRDYGRRMFAKSNQRDAIGGQPGKSTRD